MKETFDEIREEAEKLQNLSTIKFSTPTPCEPDRGEADVVFGELYGRHLHGDYDKWQRSLKTPDLVRTLAVSSWVSGVDIWLMRLSSAIDLGISEGRISYE